LVLAPRRRGRFADKLNSDTAVIAPDDFAVAFNVLAVFAKGAGHHHLLADDEALSGLDVNPPLADIFDRSLEKLAIGSEVGILRAGETRENAGFFVAHFAKPTFEKFIRAEWLRCGLGRCLVFFHFTVSDDACLDIKLGNSLF
jgi:hypothetical protein